MARTTIPAELVAINAIQGTLIADNAITAVHIATNAVSGTLVADNAITSTHIAQNNVTATQIAMNTITVTQLADSAVETAKLNNDAVTQAKIADDAVGADQLAANSVVSASIVNGTIVAADLADNAVTLAKMASLARGSIIVGDSAGDPSALSIGSNGTVLKSDGTDISWGTVSAGAALDDITTGDAASTLATSSGDITLDTPGDIILDADGGQVIFKDGGSSIGEIQQVANDLTIYSTASSHNGLRFHADGILPTDNAGAIINNDANLGDASYRFKDLYLSNDIYINDDGVIKLGNTNGDFEIYHIAGSVNVVRGTGAMVLQSDDYISLGTHSDGELMLKATKNGSTDLYYDNLVKLQTTDKGCLVQSSGSKDVTIGMSNGDQDWHIGIDESAGDYFRIGRHSGMGNNSVYHVTPGYKHEWQGAHQGDSVGHFRFSNQNQGDATNTNCSLAVINGASFVQFMAWATLGARIGTRTGGWNSTGNQVTYLVSADSTFAYGSGTNFYLGSGTAITSDERLKKNIVATPTGQLAKINALRPVSFDWKDTRKDSGEGFIAQEVEKIIPEAVAESTFAPDPDDDTRDFEGDVKSIRDGVLLSRLVKAVQELSAELDAAKARITTLEG